LRMDTRQHAHIPLIALYSQLLIKVPLKVAMNHKWAGVLL